MQRKEMQRNAKRLIAVHHNGLWRKVAHSRTVTD